MQYSKSYLRLLATNSRKRYLSTVTLSVIIFFVWFFCWYAPIEKKMVQLDREIEQLKKDSESDLEEQTVCKKLTDRFTQLQHDLQAVAEGAFSDAGYIMQLTAYVQDAHMRLVSLRVSGQKDHGWYKSIRINFEAIGTLAAITEFFTRVSDSGMFVQCDELALQRQADEHFLLQCILRRAVPDIAHILEEKSPSTLKKAEGLGG